MKTQIETTGRDAVLVEDAAWTRVMGQPILEALPSGRGAVRTGRSIPPGPRRRIRLSDCANVDTKHPHRGFDNLWYILEGSVSTGHSTGPGGAMERARLNRGRASGAQDGPGRMAR